MGEGDIENPLESLEEKIKAAKKAVKTPTSKTKFDTWGAASKRGENLQVRKTPAVTIVAAWISAETGVGPSIASGNQVCKKI